MATELIPVGIDLGSLHARVAIGDPITLGGDPTKSKEEKVLIPNIIANAQGSRYTVALTVQEQAGDVDKKNNNSNSFVFGEAARRHLSRDKKVIEHYLVRYLCSHSTTNNNNNNNDDDDDEKKNYKEACAAFFAHLAELACDASTSTSVQPSQLRIVLSMPPNSTEELTKAIQESLELGLRQLVRKKEGKKMEKKMAHQILVGVVSDASATALAFGLLDQSTKDDNSILRLSSSSTQTSTKNKKNTLIIDWGASGLTLTHLQQTQASTQTILTTTKTHTEPNCSGSFIISALVAHCASLLERKHSSMIQRGSVVKHKRAVTKLTAASEIAVKTLARTNVAQIAVDGVYEGLDLNCSLSKPRFEMLCGKVLRLAESTMLEFISQAKDVEKFDAVLMCGNVCQMPKAEALIQKLFPGETLLRTSQADAVSTGLKIPVDESVAIGCARYAQQFLMGERDKQVMVDDDSGELVPSSLAEETKELEMEVPLCPIAIGICLDQGSVQTLIDVGSPLPAHISKVIKAESDENDVSPFSIVQMIGADSKVCHRALAEIDNLSPGTKQVELTLEISDTGKLSMAIDGGETVVV